MLRCLRFSAVLYPRDRLVSAESSAALLEQLAECSRAAMCPSDLRGSSESVPVSWRRRVSGHEIGGAATRVEACVCREAPRRWYCRWVYTVSRNSEDISLASGRVLHGESTRSQSMACSLSPPVLVQSLPLGRARSRQVLPQSRRLPHPRPSPHPGQQLWRM